MNMRALNAMMVILAVGVFPTFAAAQSRDRGKPTPVTSSEVSGTSRKEDRREFYYSFTAGPGDLVVTLDVEGLSGRSDRESLVRVTLYDEASREVGEFDRQSGLNGERNRRVEKYNLQKETPLVMRLTFENGASKYKIGLSGNVAVEEPANAPVVAGEVFRLPKAGVLTIKMRDGSVHTIKLSDVQEARIEADPARR